jgi:hypothetical protein
MGRRCNSDRKGKEEEEEKEKKLRKAGKRR